MANIMVVDDDDDIRAALMELLREDGHEVRAANDGRAAARLMYEHAAEVLVSDVYMPDMDGIELLLYLNKEYPTARLVMISGGGRVGGHAVLEVAHTLGARATLTKPFSAHRLREAIQIALT